MRIAIEATLVQGNATGLGQYVINLLRAMAALKTGHEFLLFHSTPSWNGPEFGPEFKPVSYYCWKQSLGIMFRLNRELRRHRADIFHATCTTGMPPHLDLPAVSTVHDLYPLLHPEECTSAQQFFFRQLLKWTVANSDCFICNSNFTASELQKHLAIPAEKIAVTHLAPAVFADGEHREAATIRNGIICVGAIEPRKNQLGLLSAYREALSRQPAMPPLTFIGPDRGDGITLNLRIKAWGLAEKVRHFKFMPPSQIAEFYHRAALFVFPSRYEGFGIPLLEAMRYRLPALCSDIPVLHEIAGDYPVFLPPEDTAAWSKTMLDFFFGDLKNRFNYQTAEHILSKFNWQCCAGQTLDIYYKIVKKK